MTTKQQIKRDIEGFFRAQRMVDRIFKGEICDWDPTAYGKGKPGIGIETWGGKNRTWMPIDRMVEIIAKGKTIDLEDIRLVE